jgi:hypothetical protein
MSVVTNTANNASVALMPVLETQLLCRGVMFITAIGHHAFRRRYDDPASTAHAGRTPAAKLLS